MPLNQIANLVKHFLFCYKKHFAIFNSIQMIYRLREMKFNQEPKDTNYYCSFDLYTELIATVYIIYENRLFFCFFKNEFSFVSF